MGEDGIDRALVERVQQGERRAFDLLVLKYQHKLTKLIGRYIRDASEVQDVAQESFLKAYRALPNFRGDSAFYTWLYRIAINTAKNHLVSQARRPPDERSAEHSRPGRACGRLRRGRARARPETGRACRLSAGA